ncbi:cytochrome c oxidase accessory protein CcoG [Ectothiorhodospiraceae bacterium 2226]|nr:cytochrome c oxidase accessory protein CcoG [Ectothiorhodospiraceae bacterium 2226]
MTGSTVARVAIYPRSVKGRFRNLKWGILGLAYGVYFLLPWLRWDRGQGPSQAVLFDIPGRRFYLFDLVVYAQDIFWLAGLLIIAALLLFFVTGILGRVFCGYFCFQTLWTDVFLFVERFVQGERPARIRLAKAPWSVGKAAKLSLTHLLWLLIAMATAATFVLYWGDAPSLLVAMVTGEAPSAAYVTVFFLTATTYVMAGWAREQVCTYMCPYARFQSVMFDSDTRIVGYDTGRGEGKAGRAKLAPGLKTREERHAKGVGDCVDCGYCVQVCPTGIDIRNGLQIECISCALCIDACNNIMDHAGFPRGLIGYTSEKEQSGAPVRVLKPKTYGYGLALLVAVGALTWSVAAREPFELSVTQIRQPLAVTLSDGRVQNNYELKLTNKTNETARYAIGITGLQGAELEIGRFETVSLEPGRSVTLVAHVRVDPDEARQAQQDFKFVVEPVDGGDGRGEPRTWRSVFYIPSLERAEVSLVH